MFQNLDIDAIYSRFEDFEREFDEYDEEKESCVINEMHAMCKIHSVPKMGYCEMKFLESYNQSRMAIIDFGFHAVLNEGSLQLPTTFEVSSYIQNVVMVFTDNIAHPERQPKMPYHAMRGQLLAGVRRLIPQQVVRRNTKKQINLELIKGCIETNPGPNGKGPRVQRRPRRPYRPRTITRGQTGTHMVPLKAAAPTRFMRGMPPSYYLTCIYVIPMTQVVGGGTTNSLRYRSEAYDVDPALASTAMAYFSELGAIYSRYRCRALKYVFNVSNQEAFPIQMIHGFSTAVFGSTAIGANYAENRFFHTKLLSPINGAKSTQTFTQKILATTLFGSVQPLTDDLFSGSTTSATLSASATMNCYIGGISAAVPVNGFFVGGTIELDLEFYRRNDILG